MNILSVNKIIIINSSPSRGEFREFQCLYIPYIWPGKGFTCRQSQSWCTKNQLLIGCWRRVHHSANPILITRFISQCVHPLHTSKIISPDRNALHRSLCHWQRSTWRSGSMATNFIIIIFMAEFSDITTADDEDGSISVEDCHGNV